MQWLNMKFLSKLKEAFEAEKPARSVEFTEEQLKIVKGLQLLTIKPMSLCCKCW